MSIQSENWLPRHRLTVDEYHRMGEVGLLAPEAREELIEGEIIDRARIGSRHAGTIARLIHLLTLRRSATGPSFIPSPHCALTSTLNPNPTSLSSSRAGISIPAAIRRLPTRCW